MKKQVFIDTNKEGKLYIKETHRRIMPGVYFGTNKDTLGDGWILLVRLPFGYGLNIGTGFSGWAAVRSWDWSRYDYADHFRLMNKARWMKYPNAKH